MFELSKTQKTVLKKKTRHGRGPGSGLGKNAGRGHKGQTKRGHVRIGFEGGGRSAIRRFPKFRGFKARPTLDRAQITLSLINQYYADGEMVSLVTLLEKNLINDKIKLVRVIKNVDLEKKVSFDESDSLYLTKGVKSFIS